MGRVYSFLALVLGPLKRMFLLNQLKRACGSPLQGILPGTLDQTVNVHRSL